LVGVCSRAAATAREAQTSFVLFDLRTEAYACAGLEPSLTTIYPPYERRAWVLRSADRQGPASLVVVGPTPLSCAAAGLVCRSIDATQRVAALSGISPLEAVRRLGVEVRPFVP
jgi:hypothetical protein